MEWSIHSENEKLILRCTSDEESYLLRVIQRNNDTSGGLSDNDNIYEELRRYELGTISGVQSKAMEVLEQRPTFHGNLSYHNLPAEIRKGVRDLEFIDSLNEVEVSDGNLFGNFESLSVSEKRFLDKQYRDKVELPDMLSASNRITNLFVSAGFATAIVHYSSKWSVLLGVLSALLGLSLFVAIKQVRSEVTSDVSPEVDEVFEDVVDGLEHIDSSNLYAIRNVVESPFTLPFSSNVYFPVSLLEELTVEEIQSVIEHELGHHDNPSTSFITMGASMASTLLVSPLLVSFTTLQPSTMLFVVLVCYTATIQATVLLLNRYDEETADSFVSDESELLKLLLRLSPSVYHVETRFQSYIHRVFDVHPPMNERIENLYDSSTDITLDDHTWGKFVWIGTACVIIGSFLIGYGFLTFTDEPVPQSFIFYGMIITVFGIIPQFYVNKGLKPTILVSGAVGISFSVTVGLGFWMGADSVVGAVAQGRIGGQVLGLGATMAIIILFLLSSVIFDYTPDMEDISEPARDWYADVELMD